MDDDETFAQITEGVKTPEADALATEQECKEAREWAAPVAAFWQELVEGGVSKKEATWLTRHWMDQWG